MYRNEDQILNHIKRENKRVNQISQQIDSGKVIDRIAYTGLSVHERSLGVYYLTTANRGKAKYWFREATIHNLIATDEYREYAHKQGFETWENEALKLRDCTYTALLGQEMTSLDRTRKSIQGLPTEYLENYASTRPWYDFVKALETLLQDQQDKFQAHLTDLRDFTHTFDEQMALRYRGLADVLEGITDGDLRLIETGIEDTLPYHEKESSLESTKSNDLVCLPAAAMRVLALMYGFDPQIDSPYVPDALDEEYIEIRF